MGTWEYDSFGRLKKSVAGGFCDTYEYRPDGKLLNKWNNGRKVLACTYYRDGSLKSQTDVSGKTLYYAYDGDGRLQYLKEDTDTILTEYRYTDAGRIKEIITAYGIRTTYAYDEDGNISRLTIGDGTEEGLLYDAFMLYDLCGNRLLKEQYRGGSVDVTEGNRYNERNELTERVRAGSPDCRQL